MAIEKLKEDFYWVGVKDADLRVFDIIMETKKGTTYNSYLINDDKVAVFDIVKGGFYKEFKENIKSIIGDRKIDYVVVHHTELDHSGSLIDLIKDYPEVEVVGTKTTLKYLDDILNCEFNKKVADEDINLGKHTLKFIAAPNLHWPDTMFTYIKEIKSLIACDFTGSHYCPESSITEEVGEEYFVEMKYYYDCIMGPFKKFVNSALDKIKDLDIEIIAPSHGPAHVREVDKILKLYREWSIETEVDNKKVEIFYISAYENTEIMAKFFKSKLEEKGFKADVTEITQIPLEESIEKIESAKGILVGSPTINGDAVKPSWDLLSLVSPVTNRGKVAMAFGSYGWSGEGVPMLTERMKQLKLKTVAPGYKFCFVPDEKKYKEAEEYLEKFIDLMNK